MIYIYDHVKRTKRNGFEILDTETDLMDTFNEYAMSREYWIIVFPYEFVNILSQIENTYYKGEANSDFLLVLNPHMTYHIAFLRKNRMSAEQLNKIITDITTNVSQALASDDKDIMTPLFPETPIDVMNEIYAFILSCNKRAEAQGLFN